MSTADQIHQKLTQALAPTLLDIVDESHRHAGHAGAEPGGETHYTVRVASAAFAGLSRVARQRMIYGLLQEELAGRVHALSCRR